MLIATDPLSLVFIACFLCGFLFFVGTALLGNLGHSHTGHIGHMSHVGGHEFSHHSAFHAGHSTHANLTHVPAHPMPGNASGHTTTGHQQPAGHSGIASSLLSFVNPTSIMLFLLGFGFFGYVFHNAANVALPLTLVLAAICGVLISAALVLFLSRIFVAGEASTIQDVADRAGLLGKVSIPIQENSIGEILYTSPGGMRKSIAARSIDGRRIERGEEVVVLNYQHGIAEVDTWEHFINQEEPGEAPTPAPAANEEQLARLRALLEEAGPADIGLVIRKDVQKE